MAVFHDWFPLNQWRSGLQTACILAPINISASEKTIGANLSGLIDAPAFHYGYLIPFVTDVRLKGGVFINKNN